jgi:hypothetical protein
VLGENPPLHRNRKKKIEPNQFLVLDITNLKMEANPKIHSLEDMETYMLVRSLESHTPAGRNISLSFPFLTAILQSMRNARQGGEI